MSFLTYLKGLMGASVKPSLIENHLTTESSLKKPSQQKMWEQLYASHSRPIYQKMLARTQ